MTVIIFQEAARYRDPEVTRGPPGRLRRPEANVRVGMAGRPPPNHAAEAAEAGQGKPEPAEVS